MSAKGTKIIFVLFSLVLFLAGCQGKAELRDLTRIPESQNLLYTGNRELTQEQIGEKLGEVEKTGDSDSGTDLADWESANLAVGTEIYRVRGEIDGAKGNYFAYKKDGKFYLFYEFVKEGGSLN